MNYFKKYDYRVWILGLGWIASAVGFAVAIPYLAIYFHSELGISMTKIGVFFGMAAIVRSSCQAIGGEISDKFGRYYPMVLSQFFRTITFLIVALAIYNDWGFWVIGGLIIFNSIFGAFFQPAANAAVADLVNIEQRTEGYSIIRIAANLGWSLGPALGGFLAEKSYALLFILSAGMTLMSSCIIAVFLKGIKTGNRSNERFRIKDIFVLKGNELLLWHITFILILYLVVSQFMAPFSLYAVDFKGISKAQLGIIYGMNGLIVLLFQFPTTRLLRSTRLTMQLTLGAAIYAVGYFWIGLTASFAGFIIAIIIITIGENCVSPSALAITANLAPEGRTGRYMGIYGLAVTLGWSLGPLLGGVLLDLSNPQFMFTWTFIALLALVAAAGFGYMSNRIPAGLNLPGKNQ